MSNLLTIFFSACIGNNIVLIQFIGLCPFIGMSTDVNKSIGMGGAVTFVTLMATAVTYPIFKYILLPLHVDFYFSYRKFGSARGVFLEKIGSVIVQCDGRVPRAHYDQLRYFGGNPKRDCKRI